MNGHPGACAPPRVAVGTGIESAPANNLRTVENPAEDPSNRPSSATLPCAQLMDSGTTGLRGPLAHPPVPMGRLREPASVTDPHTAAPSAEGNGWRPKTASSETALWTAAGCCGAPGVPAVSPAVAGSSSGRECVKGRSLVDNPAMEIKQR